METALHGLRFAKTMQGCSVVYAKPLGGLYAVLPLICCGTNLFYEPQELCLSGIGAFENACV